MARPRSARADLATLLESASRPIYVLSEQRRIVFCNRALADWLGVEPAQLIGLRCDYHSQPGPDPLSRCAAGLCPPPAAFAGQAVSEVISCQSAAGHSIQRRADVLPLSSDPLQAAGVVVLLSSTDLPDDRLGEPERADPTAHQLHRLVAQLRQGRAERFQVSRLVGESPAMLRVRSQVELAAHSRIPVQIVGPPGSGREHLARTIHYAGAQPQHAPLVPLSCALLDAELLRTTVAAFVQRCAELETEQSAALLLLEIDQLSVEAQRELAGLLTISELEVRPLATSRRRLLDLQAAGEFREDLAFALSTLVIEVPPLAQRRSDIPLLAQALLEEVNAEGKQQRGGFTPEALDLLAAYSWPENVDELAPVVRESHRHADGPLIRVADLPRKIHLATAIATHQPPPEETMVLQDFLDEIESELIQRALKRAKGNKTKTAQLLGTNRPKLLRRIQQLGLRGPADRGD